MESTLAADGFRTWLEKAARVEEGTDWTVHCIDYGKFKDRLRFFARRRANLRSLLRASPDGRISDHTLANELKSDDADAADAFLPAAVSVGADGLPQRIEMRRNPSTNSRLGDVSPGIVETNYRPFLDAEPGSSEAASFPLSEEAESQDSLMKGGGNSARGKNKRFVMRRVSIVERREMLTFLTWEMDKVQMFYLSQWQSLPLRLEELQQSGLKDLVLGEEILELFAFCVTNIVTAHQILIRYDGFVRTFEGTPMFNFYMKKVTKHPTSFRKILFHEELNAIANTYAEGLQSATFSINFESQRLMFRDILCNLQSTQSMAPNESVGFREWAIHGVQDLLMTALLQDRLGLEPAFLTTRGKSLTQEIQQLAEWRQKKHDVQQPPPREKKSLTGMQVYHLTLNLLSAFLYCMNYYVSRPRQ
jgi:hypothetical protein